MTLQRVTDASIGLEIFLRLLDINVPARVRLKYLFAGLAMRRTTSSRQSFACPLRIASQTQFLLK
ncbi:MAG TPA: hypothetical protein V6D35_23470 [Candidatus Sericytochromatia bacterium]